MFLNSCGMKRIKSPPTASETATKPFNNDKTVCENLLFQLHLKMTDISLQGV